MSINSTIKDIVATLAIKVGTSYNKENAILAFIAANHLFSFMVTNARDSKMHPSEPGTKSTLGDASPVIHRAIDECGFIKNGGAAHCSGSEQYFIKGEKFGGFALVLNVVSLPIVNHLPNETPGDRMAHMSPERLQEYDDIIRQVAKDANFVLTGDDGYYGHLFHISTRCLTVELAARNEHSKFINIEPPYEFKNPHQYPAVLEHNSMFMLDRTMLLANWTAFGICNEYKRIYTKRFGRFKARFNYEAPVI